MNISRAETPVDIDPENPTFYAELFKEITRPIRRRTSPAEQFCLKVPGVQDLDGPLTKRLQSLLDVIATISLSRKNVAATMVRLKEGQGKLETQLYLVFNSSDEKEALACSEHIQSIFKMLHNVRYKTPMNGSPKIIADEFIDDIIKISMVIHNFSYEIFWNRVTKRQDSLLRIQRYIEEEYSPFNSEDRETLQEFLRQADIIIKIVQDRNELNAEDMEILWMIYSRWKELNILPADDLSDKGTFLDKADDFLFKETFIDFKLRRWAPKIMSFMIAATSIFGLTQSRRLRKLLDGEFLVTVLASPSTSPYVCELSSNNIQEALDATLEGTEFISAPFDEERESFIQLLKGPGNRPSFCSNPTIHAELALIMAMDRGYIRDALPYIGVSKLSCIMCSHFIQAYREVTRQNLFTRGSHGKSYPGWYWPYLPGCDEQLRSAFMKTVKGQLLDDFKRHVTNFNQFYRRNSDSTVGSGFPDTEARYKADDIYEKFEKRLVK